MADNSDANVASVKADKSGVVFWAPAGTTVPSAYTAPASLAADFLNLGYLSDDGIEDKPEAKTETSVAFGGDTVDSGQSEYSRTMSFSLLEVTNSNVLKFVFGTSNVTIDGTSKAVTIDDTGEELPAGIFILYMPHSNGWNEMIVIDSAKPAIDGSIKYENGKDYMFPITLNVFPGADGDYTKRFRTPPAVA